MFVLKSTYEAAVEEGNHYLKQLNYAFNWFDLPMPDKAVPDLAWMVDWNRRIKWEVLRDLGQGRHVLVHCKGGFGRTGLVAAMILIDALGCSADQAVEMCRTVREGAVETEAQWEFLKEYERNARHI